MKQKFQIGDVCQVINKNADSYGLYVIILNSYGQCFPNINRNDITNYNVFVPKHLNKNAYKIDEEGYFTFSMPQSIHSYFTYRSNRHDFAYEWAWVHESELKLIRKPNKKDLNSLLDHVATLDWGEYKKKRPLVWIWDSWEQMANQYIDLTEIKKESR